MANINIDKIQMKRGTRETIPVLSDGEPAICLDTKEFAIGTPEGNIYFSFQDLSDLVNEVGNAKGGYSSLQEKLSSLVSSGGSGALVYQTLADLQSAYPNGTTQPAWIVADNAWYYWSGAIVTDTTAPVLTITAGGTFTGTKSVTMSVNETADIYYTLDGSTPTTSSTKYTSPLSVSATTTLKAFAKDTAGNSSVVQTVTYTLDATPPADTTAPDNVTNLAYSNLAQTSLTLNWTASASSDVASYDVYNGSTLLANVTGITYNVSGLTASTQYTFTVKAKDAANNVASGTSVTVTTSTPADTTAPVLTITPAATFTDTQTVVMSANEAATIYYTLDDTDPKVSGTKLTYSAPLTLTETDTIKAYARDTAGNESAVQTVTYTKQVIPAGVIVQDGFNRANNTSSLGTTEIGGKTWTVNNGGSYGVINNQAYASATGTGNVNASVESGISNCSIELTNVINAASSGIVFRLQDATNFLSFERNGTGYRLYKTIAGTKTLIQTITTATAPADGDRLKVVLNGDTIQTFVNDVQVHNRTGGTAITDFQSATKHGLYGGNATNGWRADDFVIKSL